MIKEETKDLIKEAARIELSNAMESNGARFHSDHEAWAVLREEIEEAEYEHDKVCEHFYKMWDLIKENEPTDEELDNITERLFNEVYELVQCIAVVAKCRGE